MGYKRNFINSAVFQINFPTILELEEKVPTGFQSKIADKFPILRDSTELNLNFSVSSSEKLDEKEIIPLGLKKWQFHNREKNKIIALSNKSLTIEYADCYSNFKEFISDIELILKSLFEEYNIPLIDRIGVRYINQIKLSSGNPLDWKDIINEDLTSSIKFANTKNLIRTMQQLQIEEDSYYLVLRYGMPNSSYPSKIVRKEFTLDMDCFGNGEFTVEEIPILLAKYHEVIKNTFESSIGDEFRKMMNKEDEE